MEKIQFSKPYKFEGKEYTEIDLSALDDLTTEQLIQAERRFEKSGSFSALKELNTEYCMIISSQVTGLPIEFFTGLPAKEGSKIKTAVSAYFFGAA